MSGPNIQTPGGTADAYTTQATTGTSIDSVAVPTIAGFKAAYYTIQGAGTTCQPYGVSNTEDVPLIGSSGDGYAAGAGPVLADGTASAVAGCLNMSYVIFKAGAGSQNVKVHWYLMPVLR